MPSVVTDEDRTIRLRELAMESAAQQRDSEAADERSRTGNRGFVQVYPKGWRRLQKLIQEYPAGARVFAFLAENISGTEGAVVVSQEFLAETLSISDRTVRRITQRLESEGAIVRIRVAGSVYAYCLDPEEVWRSWDDKKPYAAFTTRTLVKKSDRENGHVKRNLKVMVGEPELPFSAEGTA